jgi:hypothetical protein
VSGRISIDDAGADIGFLNSGFGSSGVCDSSPVEPKTLTYEANYNELNGAGSHGYETSVTYHKVGESIVSSNQVLVQGTTIRLVPLTDGSVSTSGLNTETLEFEGGATGGTTAVSTTATPLTLLLPTQLTEKQWETILEDAENVDDDDIIKTGDRIKIELNSGTYDIRCTPIGEGKVPSNSPVLTPGSGGGAGPSPGGIGINPKDEAEVFVKSAESVKKQKTTRATFQYEPEPTGPTSTNIVSARVNFVSPDAPGFSGSGADTVRICNDAGTSSEDFEVAGDTKSFDVPITVDDSGQDMKFTFNPGESRKITAKSFYVITFKLSNGDVSTYFLSHPDGSGGSGPPACPTPTT